MLFFIFVTHEIDVGIFPWSQREIRHGKYCLIKIYHVPISTGIREHPAESREM